MCRYGDSPEEAEDQDSVGGQAPGIVNKGLGMGIFIEGVMGDLAWVLVSWCERGMRDYCCRADEEMKKCIDREHFKEVTRITFLLLLLLLHLLDSRNSAVSLRQVLRLNPNP
jgi:hypothetical protein